MQNFTKFLSLFLLLGVLSSASCEKELEEPDGPEKLIPGRWLRSKIEYSTDGTTWSLSSNSCQLDDIEEYTSDGKWLFSGGSDICSSSTGTPTGTYRLAEEGTKIIFIYSHTPGEYEKNIELLDQNTMILNHNIRDINNTQARTTYLRQ